MGHRDFNERLYARFCFSTHPLRRACEHIDVVHEKLSEWVQEGFVEELAVPAHCCNPLGVAVKYDVNSDELKFHPVLDLSRHVNYLVAHRTVQLDDLPQIAD